jgi:syntaxin 5
MCLVSHDVLSLFDVQNLKVHENRRQIFSATASKDQTTPFARQHPLAAASSTSTNPLSGSHAPWANGATSNSQLFSSRYSHANPLIFQGLKLVLVEFD